MAEFSSGSRPMCIPKSCARDDQMKASVAIQPDHKKKLKAQLADSICGCSIARNALTQPIHAWSSEELSCASVLISQGLDLLASTPHAWKHWQVPEPWNGHLDQAPLLFVGQNPSFDIAEDYPTRSTLLGGSFSAVDYYDRRFECHIRGGTKVRRKGVDNWSPSNRFLSAVRVTAELIYHGLVNNTDLIPGTHYAITEAVRCKARNAHGIHLAATTCGNRYMLRTLLASNARVIVCFGRLATESVCKASGVEGLSFGGSLVRWKTETESMAMERLIVSLPHPSARGLTKQLEEATLTLARANLWESMQSRDNTPLDSNS